MANLCSPKMPIRLASLVLDASVRFWRFAEQVHRRRYVPFQALPVNLLLGRCM